MEIEKLKRIVIEALEDIKAEDIQVLDVREITSIADYMIVASGKSGRQVKALAQNVVEEAKKNGVQPIGTEGEEKAEWVLVDLGDIIIHVLKPETREFYQLEKLWASQADEVESQE
ncbi:MAG: ribosome silencing factor [Gammaproteobacteria bacterium]